MREGGHPFSPGPPRQLHRGRRRRPSDAYYCRECCILEKDRDGCPKIINLGSARTDLYYERKKYGFKKR